MSWGSYKPHNHLSSKNITNAILFTTSSIPWLALSNHITTTCNNTSTIPQIHKSSYQTIICNTHPFILINIIFLITITFYFWIIGLLQKSFWLIDPYWTLLPLLISLFYFNHPSSLLLHPAKSLHDSKLRCHLSFGLLVIWSVRLTHSYFRYNPNPLLKIKTEINQT